MNVKKPTFNPLGADDEEFAQFLGASCGLRVKIFLQRSSNQQTGREHSRKYCNSTQSTTPHESHRLAAPGGAQGRELIISMCFYSGLISYFSFMI